MTNEEKRYDAAHTLVVPYDATPAAVDAAYVERMRQYTETKTDDDLWQTKADHLYDAHIRMRMSPSRQWIANSIIRLSPRFERDYATLNVLVRIICEYMGPLGVMYNAELSKLLARARALDREKRFLFLFEIAAIWTVPYINDIRMVMVGGGAMLAAGIRMVWCTAKRDKKMEEFKIKEYAMFSALDMLKLREKMK